MLFFIMNVTMIEGNKKALNQRFEGYSYRRAVEATGIALSTIVRYRWFNSYIYSCLEGGGICVKML